MIAATILAVFFIPTFFIVFQGLDEFLRRKKPQPKTEPQPH